MKLKIIIFCLFGLLVIGITSFSRLENFVKTTPYNLEIPTGFPEMPIPAENPLTVEGVYLGRKLFYEPLLSGNNKMSCGTCHQQKYAFSDSTIALSTGIDGIKGKRNTLPLFNLSWVDVGYFWDGRTKDLESQVIEPIQNPIEMHESLDKAVIELQNKAEYPRLFKKAFGSKTITIKMVMNAIAQFERTLISSNSKYDKYVRAEPSISLTDEEREGLNLFNSVSKGNCIFCHPLNSSLTTSSFKNVGLDSIPQDNGRYTISLADRDKGRFKTPSLRNVELTAPYMHDGRFKTLEDVLDHYTDNFKITPYTEKQIYKRGKGKLTASEKKCIIQFLKTLTDYEFITNSKFSNPNSK